MRKREVQFAAMVKRWGKRWGTGYEATVLGLAQDILQVLRTDNPKLDGAAFLEACGITLPTL